MFATHLVTFAIAKYKTSCKYLSLLCA